MTLPALLLTGAVLLASPMIWVTPDGGPLAAPAVQRPTGAQLQPALLHLHPRGARLR
jgi:hypothetical protein